MAAAILWLPPTRRSARVFAYRSTTRSIRIHIIPCPPGVDTRPTLRFSATACRNGIEHFLTPGKEALVVRDGADVAEAVASLTPAQAARIGTAALARVLSDHTYDRRAESLHLLLTDLLANRGADYAA